MTTDKSPDQPTRPLPHHIHIIASMLDHPSVYMGGPSRHSVRMAERIWTALRADNLVKEIDSEQS